MDRLKFIDCSLLDTIKIGKNNFSKDSMAVNLYLTNLRSLKTLIIGSDACKNVFLLQLGRPLLVQYLMVDLVMLKTFIVEENGFCNCKSARFLSRVICDL